MDLPPFASVADLVDRGMTLSGSQMAAATVLLGDASEHIRSLVGQVWPQTQSTITLWAGPGLQWLPVPLVPLISIDSVTVTRLATVGEAVSPVVTEVVEFDGKIRVCGPAKVTVTCTHGFTNAPADLVSWTCVLAAEAVKNMQELGMFAPGMVASVAIDDYRVAYQQLGADSRGAFTLPEKVIEQLQAKYGGGAYVTGVAP